MLKKQQNIDSIFTNIAKDYDLMNNVISLGTHKILKRKAVKLLAVNDFEIILDLAGGTGDLAIIISEKSNSQVVIADRNQKMLAIAKDRVHDAKRILCDVENLPFKNDSIDKVIIGFGIRNFSNLDLAFENIFRVMKNDGKLVIIEFAQPPCKIILFFRNIYFRKIIPFISQIMIKKKQEYHYLASSIINFPEQSEIISLLEKQSFQNCNFQNYLFGGIAIYNCNK